MNILIIDAINTPGKQILKYLSENTEYNIFGTWDNEEKLDLLLNQLKDDDRSVFKNFKLDIYSFHIFYNIFSIVKPDYIINCVSIDDTINNNLQYNNCDYVLYNSLWPNYLEQICKNKCKLIHITNNDVYLTKRTNSEYEPHDEVGFIGKSKSLGVLSDSMSIRVSGFMDDYNPSMEIWSGITSKEFGSVCKQIIEQDLYEKGIYNIYSTTNDGTPDQYIWSIKDFQTKLKIKSVEKQLEELLKE